LVSSESLVGNIIKKISGRNADNWISPNSGVVRQPQQNRPMCAYAINGSANFFHFGAQFSCD